MRSPRPQARDLSAENSDEFTPGAVEALTHDTPFFLVSKRRLTENFRLFQEAFPGATVHYAIKANPEPMVLLTLASEGSAFEVASAFELDLLEALDTPPSRIVYGSSVKPMAHIQKAYEYGVDRFAVDSLSELDKIASGAPGSRVYVRAKVDDTHSVFRFSEKFGAEPHSIEPLFKRALALGLRPYGLSFHVGSQAGSAGAWADALQSLHSVITNLISKGLTVETLNLGGGFPCAYASSANVADLQDIATRTLRVYESLPCQPDLLIEPGRGVVANACILVASVIARIDRAARTWLFLDAGCYNGLFEAMAYQGGTRYQVTRTRESPQPNSHFALAGPTGDSPDVITRDVKLPADTDVGDKLIFSNAGAYTVSMTIPFNGFPKPEIHYL